MLTHARVATNLPLLGYTFLKYPYLGLNCKKEELATEGRPRTSRSICHGITRKRHGRKMRRQKKDWTSAYAKVTNARGKGDQGAEGQTSPIPSFHAKAGNPEIQAAKERQIKREASFLDLSSFVIFASSR